MKAFKIACLQYRPTPVCYRDKTFKRSFLLKMRKVLIQKCEEVIKGQAFPFRHLQPMKVFSDLLEFYEEQKESERPKTHVK